MKVFPIKSPVDGEQVVAVHPELKRFGDADWRRRVNNFTGRSLTHTALRTEQAGRSGRVASLGQLLSPGVVDGLVADKAILQISSSEQQQVLNISSGHGLDASGEVVTLNAPLEVEINEIPVYAPVTILEGAPASAHSGGALHARKLGPSLDTVVSLGRDIPPLAILLLQPVQVEMNLQQSDDPCELDPEHYAYENWQLVDGARLVLYSWPQEVLSLPGNPGDANWRNQIANSIFSYEKNLAADELLPWASVGVPLAVIGFDSSWQALFVDRHAAMRAGGKRRRQASILSDIGNRFLWQARFQQFNEQLAEIVGEIPVDQDASAEASTHFRYLPPVGVLPKDFINLDTDKQHFFPLSYHVEAVAIPYEQLDVVVQDSAALAAYDFNRADRVQALVPVPQTYFEPDLLKTEIIDPEFDQTIAGFVDARNNWLGRRLEIRRKASTITQAVRGEALEYASPDPAAVDIAELAVPFEDALIEFGDNWRYLKGTGEPPSGWESSAFADSSWSSGNSGIGFNSSSVETELDDMQDGYISLFLRKSFNLAALDVSKNYHLEILTNGGFFAYLNGTEVGNDNLEDRAFDTTADAEVDIEVRRFDLGNLASELVAGVNLLAFQVHAAQLSSKSFVFLPRLVEKQYVADLETDDYGTQIKVDSSGNPELEAGEPLYRISAVQDLRTFFDSRTYKAADDSIKRIWSTEDIEKFDNIANEGVEGFIDYLQDKVNKANDKVDFGFVRLQTDIYRLRQFILGNEEATKLATSPVLATIARGQTAVATKEDITKVVSLLSAQSQVSFSSDNSPSDSASVAAKAFTPRAGSERFFSGDLGGLDLGSSSGDLEREELLKDSGGIEGLLAGARAIDGGEEKLALRADSTGGGDLFGEQKATVRDIEEQSSIIGSFPIFHNVTVGERLQKAVTEDAVDAGRANRVENIVNIQSTGLSMDGIGVPGLKAEGSDLDLPFGSVTSDVLAGIISGANEPGVKDNEASRFNDSVLNLERSTALLRLVEGRIKTYRVMIDRCNKTLRQLFAIRKRMDPRLKVIEDELAEARHDVSVSRALKAEEEERIAAINARRTAILEEHVPFLVYRRPRLSDVLLDAPLHDLHPDLSDAPLPLCDVDEDETPEEISAMMDVLREAPLKWFKLSSRVIKRINRLPDLRILLKGARLRANTKTTRHRLLSKRYDGRNKLALGINKTLLATHNLISLQRRQTALIDIAKFDRLGWEESRKRATEVISLGDIIDGNHGRMGASKLAAAELEQISQVTVCLYLQLAQALPSIRLDWAERLSQYDAPFNLRNLYSLPRWGEIDYIERNEMQRLVDWLYGRINAVYSDASDMVNDLVRICILLASHAPVNKLISGLVPEPTTVKIGSKINIVADLTRVRIGMNIAMVSGSKTVARGRVADIVGGRVQAKIISTLTTSTTIEKNTRVQIGEPRATGGASYKQNRYIFKR